MSWHKSSTWENDASLDHHVAIETGLSVSDRERKICDFCAWQGRDDLLIIAKTPIKKWN